MSRSSSTKPAPAPTPQAVEAPRAKTRRKAGVPADTGTNLSDRFFRHLVLNLRNGVLAIARDGRIAAMNDIAYRVLGLQAKSTDLGQPFADVLLECPEVVRVLQSAFDGSDLPNRAELRLRKTGRAIGYTISHIHDDEGQQVGLTLFFKDLTRVEQIEERERLRDRLATLGEMAAAIAHEVKNPLASIEVMAGVLRRQLTDRPEAMETLGDIIKESKMANAIVVEVLEFVRPIRLQVEHIAITEVIKDAISGLEDGAHFVTVQVDDDVPLLTADPNQLRQLFTNLITNALEAMEVTVGERRVDIRASLVPEDAEPASAGQPLPAQVRIEVKDNGPGISEDDLERIFSPFFTTKPQGTGLGLSIVRKVVDAHDGIIDATSAPGRGTTFRVTLPVVPAPDYLTEQSHGTYSRR
jgi:signal transduction histidine kinase